MRVAFLTDVHGNLPALEAVLAHARTQGADEVWNGGDMVGYGPQPEACVQRLRECRRSRWPATTTSACCWCRSGARLAGPSTR